MAADEAGSVGGKVFKRQAICRDRASLPRYLVNNFAYILLCLEGGRNYIRIMLLHLASLGGINIEVNRSFKIGLSYEFGF